MPTGGLYARSIPFAPVAKIHPQRKLFATSANKLQKLLAQKFCLCQNAFTRRAFVASRIWQYFINPFFGKPIVNANLTNSTNYGDRDALVSSSLVGKCVSVMPAAAAARAWLTGGTGTQYGPQSSSNQIVRSVFGTDKSGTSDIHGLGAEAKQSIRRSCKPRVANA